MKKLLVIAYYWPPAGGPGVQRWLKFVKYLPKFGFEPIVYVPENPNYPILDTSLVADIPENVTILKQPIKEPYKLAAVFSKSKSKTISKGIIHKPKSQSLIERLMLFVRGNFFIPDARKAWVKPSVAFLSKYINEHSIETIITTGPPHSLHLIGLHLKQHLAVTWMADFRDPWTTIGYHKQLKLTKFSREKHINLEQKVLNGADKIIVTSNNTLKEFQVKTETPIKVITNGYDSHTVQRPSKDEKFTIAHIGSLLSERNPLNLWQALSELVNEYKDFKAAFQLKLIGSVSQDVLETIYSYGLKNHTEVLGYLDHEEAIKQQMASQLLLLIEINSEYTKAIIPGKLFEYMSSGTPTLAIGPKDSDIETLITATNTGKYFDYDSVSELKNQILLYFQAYKTKSLQSNPIGIQQYSREALTKTLAEFISWEL